MQTDLHCICAQVADILADPIARQDFLKAQNDQAQQLLDLLQDVSSLKNIYAVLILHSFWTTRS